MGAEMEIEKLLPCPFCGGDADQFAGDTFCDNRQCSAIIQATTKAESGRRWNKRHAGVHSNQMLDKESAAAPAPDTNSPVCEHSDDECIQTAKDTPPIFSMEVLYNTDIPTDQPTTTEHIQNTYSIEYIVASEQPDRYGYDPGTPDGDVPALTFRKGDQITCILHGDDARVVAAFIKDLAEAQPERESVNVKDIEAAIRRYIGMATVAQVGIAEVAAHAVYQNFEIRRRG